MAANKEEVSVSFHYLYRHSGDPDSEDSLVPFTSDDLIKISDRFNERMDLDLKDKELLSKVRAKTIAPIDRLDPISATELCGRYFSSYSGHSFTNNEKGKISARSVNLRPFFFYLYLSESGRIYVASQYLGTYGGYTQLMREITSALGKPASIVSRTFNVANVGLDDVEIQDVSVSFSRKPTSAAAKNAFGRRGVVTIKSGIDKEEFKQDFLRSVRSRVAPTQQDSLRSAINGLLRDSDLVELDDDEIDSCKMIVRSGKKKRTLYVLSGYNYATKFPLDVEKDRDGHPKCDQLKPEVRTLLKTEIIAKKEDV